MQHGSPDIGGEACSGAQKCRHGLALPTDPSHEGAKEPAVIVGEILKGRQIPFHVVRSLRVSETDSAILEFQDLLNIGTKGGDLRPWFITNGVPLLPVCQSSRTNCFSILCLECRFRSIRA